jgi:hypothetical protein
MLKAAGKRDPVRRYPELNNPLSVDFGLHATGSQQLKHSFEEPSQPAIVVEALLRNASTQKNCRQPFAMSLTQQVGPDFSFDEDQQSWIENGQCSSHRPPKVQGQIDNSINRWILTRGQVSRMRQSGYDDSTLRKAPLKLFG